MVNMEKLYIETQQETLRDIKCCVDSELACTVVFGQVGSGKSWIAKELYDSLLTDKKILLDQDLFNSLDEIDFMDLVKSRIIEVNEFIIIFDFNHDELYRMIVDILNLYCQINAESYNKNIKLVFFTTDKFREVLSRFNSLNFVNIKNITGEEAEMFFDEFVGFGISEYRLKHLKFLFRKTDHSPGEILKLAQRKTRKKSILQLLISSYFYGFCAFLIVLILIMYTLFDVSLFAEYKLKRDAMSSKEIEIEKEIEKEIETGNDVLDEIFEGNNVVKIVSKNPTYDNSQKLNLHESSLRIFYEENDIVENHVDGKNSSETVDDKLSGGNINQLKENKEQKKIAYFNGVSKNNGAVNEVDFEKVKLELHTLTIRSNLYNDKVYIDGVFKGSTPITLSIPSNNYRILVKKNGYESYVDDINLNESNFIYAVLKPTFRVNMYSEQIRKGTFGPVMLHVSGLDSSISDDMSISEKLITYEDIEKFSHEIMKTIWKKKYSYKGLASNDYHEIQKGFFNINTPVTCLSKKDIQHYINWLSEGSGFQYRLPTVDELNFFYLYNDEVSDFNKVGFRNANFGGERVLNDIERNAFGIYDEFNDVWQYAIDTEQNDRMVIWNGGVNYFHPDKHENCGNEAATSSIGFRVVRENASSEY